MKKLISTLIALVAIVSFGFSQEASNTATSEGKVALVESKVSGEYNFVLAADQSKEKVEKAASYYTPYFTVNYDETANSAKITMIDDEPRSKFIIARFLSATGAQYVKVDDSVITMDQFIQSYIQ